MATAERPARLHAGGFVGQKTQDRRSDRFNDLPGFELIQFSSNTRSSPVRWSDRNPTVSETTPPAKT